MPIFNRLPSIEPGSIDGGELGKRHSQAFFPPLNRDEHLFLTLFFRGHSDDIDLIVDEEWRDSTSYLAKSFFSPAQGDMATPLTGLVKPEIFENLDRLITEISLGNLAGSARIIKSFPFLRRLWL